MGHRASPVFLTLIAVCLFSGLTTLQSQDPADAIFVGGPILTMEGNSPSYVEAVAVSGGRIAFAGSAAEAMKRLGPATVFRDLGGNALLPGFIDCHGHIEAAGYDGLWANARPSPDGVCDDIPTSNGGFGLDQVRRPSESRLRRPLPRRGRQAVRRHGCWATCPIDCMPW